MQQARPHHFHSVEPAAQLAAICWRQGSSGIEVLLITSRETRRWVIPKGWPVKGLAPHLSAAREAWEEAGVEGMADPAPMGRFHYTKQRSEFSVREVAVDVFCLQVQRIHEGSYPEAGQRKRVWRAPAEAARMVAEPELAALLAGFDPVPQAS